MGVFRFVIGFCRNDSFVIFRKDIIVLGRRKKGGELTE